jgi:hypothetical protein
MSHQVTLVTWNSVQGTHREKGTKLAIWSDFGTIWALIGHIRPLWCHFMLFRAPTSTQGWFQAPFSWFWNHRVSNAPIRPLCTSSCCLSHQQAPTVNFRHLWLDFGIIWAPIGPFDAVLHQDTPTSGFRQLGFIILVVFTHL